MSVLKDFNLKRHSIPKHAAKSDAHQKRYLESKTADFKCYALVIDESTNPTNKVHFAIFIRGIESEDNVTEFV